jgi:hypothetical protein
MVLVRMRRTLDLLKLEHIYRQELKMALGRYNIDLDKDLELQRAISNWGNSHHLLKQVQR